MQFAPLIHIKDLFCFLLVYFFVKPHDTDLRINQIWKNLVSLGTLLLAASHKNTWFFPLFVFLAESTKMPKVTQCAGIKFLDFLHQEVPKELLTENLAYFSMVCSGSLKNLKKLDKWKTKEEVATEEQKVVFLRNRKKSSK